MNPKIDRLIRFLEAKNDDDSCLEVGEDVELIDFLREIDMDLTILKDANKVQHDRLGDLEQRLQSLEATTELQDQMLKNSDKALDMARGERDYWQRVAQNLAKEMPTSPLRPIDDYARSGEGICVLTEHGDWTCVNYQDDDPQFPWECGEGGERIREDLVVGYIKLPDLKELIWGKK